MSRSFIWPAVRCWPLLLAAVGCLLLVWPGHRAVADGTLDLAATGADAIRGVGPRVELELADGGTVVLSSIIVPGATADAASSTLAALLDRAAIVVESSAPADRYGRLPVQAATPDGRSLQEELLEAGIALVQPLPGSDDAVLAPLLAAEAQAERAGVGLWRSPGQFIVDSAVETAGQALGRFVLLEGRVLQASEQQRYFYLNFGTDWRTDASARIDKDALRAMQDAGFDPLTLEGQRVRLRGTLFAANGPMIELWTHMGIEILP